MENRTVTVNLFQREKRERQRQQRQQVSYAGVANNTGFYAPSKSLEPRKLNFNGGNNDIRFKENMFYKLQTKDITGFNFERLIFYFYFYF